MELTIRIKRRLRLRKNINIILCLVICAMGISTAVFTYFNDTHPYYYNFRYLTFGATLFSVIAAGFSVAVNTCGRAFKNRGIRVVLYYMRLSSAVTETIIFITALVYLHPGIPQEPFPMVYDMAVNHYVITVLVILSFLFCDIPIGKLSFAETFNGLIVVTVYTVGLLIAIGTGVLRRKLIPYFFADIKHNPVIMTVLSFAVFFVFGYLISLLLSSLNRFIFIKWIRDVAGSSSADEIVQYLEIKK